MTEYSHESTFAHDESRGAFPLFALGRSSSENLEKNVSRALIQKLHSLSWRMSNVRTVSHGCKSSNPVTALPRPVVSTAVNHRKLACIWPSLFFCTLQKNRRCFCVCKLLSSLSLKVAAFLPRDVPEVRKSRCTRKPQNAHSVRDFQNRIRSSKAEIGSIVHGMSRCRKRRPDCADCPDAIA